MDWANSEWLPWYRPDTAGWLELSLAARGAMAEVARKLDKRGELHLGRRGLPALATLLRVKWDEELAPAMSELLTDGRLAWNSDDGILSDPDYEKRRRPTSTERVRAFRERVGNVGNVSVTQNRIDQNRSDQSGRERARGPRMRLAGTALPDDWAITPGLLSWAKGKGVAESESTAAADRFARHWHTSTKDNALKRNWDKAFQAWVTKDIDDGKITPVSTVAPTVAAAPTAEQLDRRARGRQMAADAIAQMDARKVVAQ